MKRISVLLFLLSSCKQESTFNCYTCNQRITVNDVSTFRTFKECGTSKKAVEDANNTKYKNGNQLFTRCVLDK